jgi:flavin reductase (DIM6/NTAB) family NADH-FMN oxidoreductase RutF
MDNLKRLDFNQIDAMDHRFRAMFVNSLTGFKSVALIGTKSLKGEENLSIVNSIVHIGSHPPLIGFFCRPRSVERHTIENMIQSGCYSINQIKESFFEKAHQTSARYPRSVSEFEATGLTPIYKGDLNAPFVAESHVQIGMYFKEQIHISLNDTVLLIGEVRDVYFPESILEEDGYLNIEKAGTISWCGLDSYHTTNRIGRMQYAKVNLPPSRIES